MKICRVSHDEIWWECYKKTQPCQRVESPWVSTDPLFRFLFPVKTPSGSHLYGICQHKKRCMDQWFQGNIIAEHFPNVIGKWSFWCQHASTVNSCKLSLELLHPWSPMVETMDVEVSCISRHSKRWKLILEVCRRLFTEITLPNGIRPVGRLTNQLCCTYIIISIILYSYPRLTSCFLNQGFSIEACVSMYVFKSQRFLGAASERLLLHLCRLWFRSHQQVGGGINTENALEFLEAGQAPSLKRSEKHPQQQSWINYPTHVIIEYKGGGILSNWFLCVIIVMIYYECNWCSWLFCTQLQDFRGEHIAISMLSIVEQRGHGSPLTENPCPLANLYGIIYSICYFLNCSHRIQSALPTTVWEWHVEPTSVTNSRCWSQSSQKDTVVTSTHQKSQRVTSWWYKTGYWKFNMAGKCDNFHGIRFGTIINPKKNHGTLCWTIILSD